MKILIIGANGQIGQQVVQLLGPDVTSGNMPISLALQRLQLHLIF